MISIFKPNILFRRFFNDDRHVKERPLACADDVNLIGDDIRTIERNADVLLNAL